MQASQGSSAATPRFRAFLSYSHADKAAAQRLHRRLENYRLPRRLKQGEANICILSRQHAPSSWLAEHEDLTDTAHSLWAEEWAAFRAGWERLAVAA